MPALNHSLVLVHDERPYTRGFLAANDVLEIAITQGFLFVGVSVPRTDDGLANLAAHQELEFFLR